ncbi:MAG: hypothetical protein ABIA93_05725 [Candidatus Woesearchaeota archaeon]
MTNRENRRKVRQLRDIVMVVGGTSALLVGLSKCPGTPIEERIVYQGQTSTETHNLALQYFDNVRGDFYTLHVSCNPDGTLKSYWDARDQGMHSGASLDDVIVTARIPATIAHKGPVGNEFRTMKESTLKAYGVVRDSVATVYHRDKVAEKP